MISNDDLLLELQKITQGQRQLEERVKKLEKGVYKKIDATEGKLTKQIETTEENLRQEFIGKIEATEEHLQKKIDDSQADTIDILSALIHTGYNLHEKRIKNLEKML